jgi:hypothetical protein
MRCLPLLAALGALRSFGLDSSFEPWSPPPGVPAGESLLQLQQRLLRASCGCVPSGGLRLPNFTRTCAEGRMVFLPRNATRLPTRRSGALGVCSPSGDALRELDYEVPQYLGVQSCNYSLFCDDCDFELPHVKVINCSGTHRLALRGERLGDLCGNAPGACVPGGAYVHWNGTELLASLVVSEA